MMFLGEVGLNGEVRPLHDIAERIKFASRNKFDSIILPEHGKKYADNNINIKYISHIKEINNVA